MPDIDEEKHGYGMDRFEQSRQSIWGQPGFIHRRSTMTADGTSFFPSATWVVQTVITDDAAAIFLESISKEGGQRIVLPTRVTMTIFRHHDEIMKRRRSMRAQRAATTRKSKQRVESEPGNEA